MPKPFPCPDCTYHIPLSAERCPHCGRPGLFPNVRAAEDAAERTALNKRYKSALASSTKKGTVVKVKNFGSVTSKSTAVLARSANELQRLVTSDNELYATYYQLIEGGVRTPTGDKWDRLRRLADSTLFTGYEKHIRFAALSLDGIGLFNYGECSISLRTDMIAHRASVFEENSVLFMQHRGSGLHKGKALPRGYRSLWGERHKLCVAKLYKKINSATLATQYPGILLHQGLKSEDDDFVEVHIWGPMTIRTVEQVAFTPSKGPDQDAIIEGLKERLVKAGVKVK
jgi:hypothetical protein